MTKRLAFLAVVLTACAPPPATLCLVDGSVGTCTPAPAPDAAPDAAVGPPQIVVRPFDRIVMAGDSLTLQGYWNWWKALVDNAYAFSSRPTFVNAGVNGRHASELLRKIKTEIIDQNPTILVLQVGIVDVTGLVKSTDDEFLGAYRGILSRMRAAKPDCQLVCVSLFSAGEDWPSGANPFDVDADRKRDLTRQAAEEYGCTFIDARSEFMAWEAINNPSHLTEGVATIDGIHQTPLGVLWSSDVLVRRTRLVP
jgi:hypothetical protein